VTLEGGNEISRAGHIDVKSSRRKTVSCYSASNPSGRGGQRGSLMKKKGVGGGKNAGPISFL